MNKNKITKLLATVGGLTFWTLIFKGATALAAGDPSATGLKNPLQWGSFADAVPTLMDGLIRIGVIVAVVYLVYVGYLYVSAVGKPDKIKTANNALLYAVIGIAVLVGSKAIAVLVSNTLKTVTGK